MVRNLLLFTCLTLTMDNSLIDINYCNKHCYMLWWFELEKIRSKTGDSRFKLWLM